MYGSVRALLSKKYGDVLASQLFPPKTMACLILQNGVYFSCSQIGSFFQTQPQPWDLWGFFFCPFPGLSSLQDSYPPSTHPPISPLKGAQSVSGWGRGTVHPSPRQPLTHSTHLCLNETPHPFLLCIPRSLTTPQQLSSFLPGWGCSYWRSSWSQSLCVSA